MVAAAHVSAQSVHVFGFRSLDIAIAKECESVLVSPSGSGVNMATIARSFIHLPNVVVLHSRIFDRFQKVYGRSGPQIDPVLHLAVLEP